MRRQLAPLQAYELPVGAPVGHNSSLQRLQGLGDSGELRSPRLRALVPILGLRLALLLEHAHEVLVCLLLLALLRLVGLSLAKLLRLLLLQSFLLCLFLLRKLFLVRQAEHLLLKEGVGLELVKVQLLLVLLESDPQALYQCNDVIGVVAVLVCLSGLGTGETCQGAQLSLSEGQEGGLGGHRQRVTGSSPDLGQGFHLHLSRKRRFRLFERRNRALQLVNCPTHVCLLHQILLVFFCTSFGCVADLVAEACDFLS
mmetsp:Transcript_115183/g.246152  ORF Transcript_115183/g.246152 Transcript_115183/m.246152 type:complete len:256 (-) Transcript_115183:110-877(-)